METLPRIFADFNNADVQGRIRLNTKGTFDDLEKYRIELKPGLEIILNDNDELEANGIVEYSIEENIWGAHISWNKLYSLEQ